MIDKNTYWSTGITLKWNGAGLWWASAKFEQGEHCRDGSMILNLATKYAQPIEEAITALLDDAASMGLVFIEIAAIKPPRLYIENESKPFAPIDWREILRAQAERLGWETYKSEASK